MRARALLVTLAFSLGVWLVPARLCARDAADLYAGAPAAQDALARGVAGWALGDVSEASFATGSQLFDGEWMFGSYMMAAMGLGQVALQHPELRASYAPVVDRCIERMLAREVSAFDRRSWGEDGNATLDGPHGHAAYLGYMNLAIGMHRMLEPGSRHATVGDAITNALARRLDASAITLLETYPGEVYPVDNAAVIASIALRDTAAHDDAHAGVVARAVQAMRARYMDRETGLLVQAVDPESGAPRDAARGSGTLLAVYFLAFADPALSRDLWGAAVRVLDDRVLGFGVMREYPGSEGGRADIDSGPVVLGYGVSATGFALAGARVHGDSARYRRLYATAHLFGAPIDRDGARRYVTGGPIGDAILLAMLTAPKGGGA